MCLFSFLFGWYRKLLAFSCQYEIGGVGGGGEVVSEKSSLWFDAMLYYLFLTSVQY